MNKIKDGFLGYIKSSISVQSRGNSWGLEMLAITRHMLPKKSYQFYLKTDVDDQRTIIKGSRMVRVEKTMTNMK